MKNENNINKNNEILGIYNDDNKLDDNFYKYIENIKVENESYFKANGIKKKYYIVTHGCQMNILRPSNKLHKNTQAYL